MNQTFLVTMLHKLHSNLQEISVEIYLASSYKFFLVEIGFPDKT